MLIWFERQQLAQVEMFPINSVIAEALKVKRKRMLTNSSSTTPSPLLLDKSVFCQLRAAVKGADHDHRDLLLQELKIQLFLELGSAHGAVRLKALVLLDFLCMRVPAFRALVCAPKDLRALVGSSQSAGLPFLSAQRSAPKDYQAEVRAASLRMIETW
jgi:hypothetical protein